MQGIAVIVGVVLFLWASAVISTSFAMRVSDGRLGKREWRLTVIAIVILVGLLFAYLQMESRPPALPESSQPSSVPAVL